MSAKETYDVPEQTLVENRGQVAKKCYHHQQDRIVIRFHQSCVDKSVNSKFWGVVSYILPTVTPGPLPFGRLHDHTKHFLGKEAYDPRFLYLYI